jgi:hypothetical protein
MKTQKQLLEESRIQLDAAWNTKYPNGQFCLQLLKQGWRGLTENKWGIHWLPSRPTSHAVPLGVSVVMPEGKEVSINGYRGVSNGCTNYSSLPDLLKAAKRRKVPEKMIEAFIDALDTHQKVQLLK